MSTPQCACGRKASDWIPVPRNGRTVRWEPDLREVTPGTYKCWACRRELHPDMPDDYVTFDE